MRRNHRGFGLRGGWAAVLLCVLLTACGDDRAALRVDGIGFGEDELLGLTTDRQSRLVELTALGLAVAREEPDRLGAPLLERRHEDLLLERFRAFRVLEASEVGDEVLRAQYETDPRYELVVRHVVALAEPGQPDSVHRAARGKAERALERVESGEPLARVAAEMSEEPGAAERGGRLEPGRRGSWVPEFWRAANSLEEGQHTGVVETQYGYHVIQLEERRIVPFEEVRTEEVLEAGRMIGGLDEAWARWSDSVGTAVELDTASVRRWRQGEGRTADTLALPASVADSTVLARTGDEGAGSAYRLGAFRRHTVSLEEGRWRELLEGPLGEALSEVRREAVRHRALATARDRGLELPASEEERLAREWRNRVSGWGASLGFRAGASADSVKARALAALSSTRQNARIARRELEPRGPLLRAAYPVHGLPRPGNEDGDGSP